MEEVFVKEEFDETDEMSDFADSNLITEPEIVCQVSGNFNHALFKEDEKQFLREWIKLYRDLPALWKIKSPEYTDKKKKSEAYVLLLRKYKEKFPYATIEDLRKKINSLRTNFRRELKKVIQSMNSGVESQDVYAPNLWYFGDMLFLEDQESPSPFKTTFRLRDQESQYSSINTIFQQGQENPSANKSTIKEFIEEQEGNTTSNDDITEARNSPITPKPLHRFQRKRKVERDNDMHEKLISLACKKLCQPENEYSNLSKTWATELSKMNETQQIWAKKAINDIIFEGQLGTLHRHAVQINAPTNKASAPTSIDLSNSQPRLIYIPTSEANAPSCTDLQNSQVRLI